MAYLGHWHQQNRLIQSFQGMCFILGYLQYRQSSANYTAAHGFFLKHQKMAKILINHFWLIIILTLHIKNLKINDFFSQNFIFFWLDISVDPGQMSLQLST